MLEDLNALLLAGGEDGSSPKAAHTGMIEGATGGMIGTDSGLGQSATCQTKIGAKYDSSVRHRPALLGYMAPAPVWHAAALGRGPAQCGQFGHCDRIY